MNEQYKQYAVPPDREFASRLQVELEARLAARQPSATDLTEENELMTVETEQPEHGRRRWMLAVAASLIALVAAGVVLATRNADSSTPPSGDSGQPRTPITTATPTTTAAPTTTIPPLSDAQIANAVLLEDKDYDAPGFLRNWSLPVRMNAEIASEHPECAAYVDVVFDSPSRPAAIRYAAFYHEISSPAAMFEYVVVHPDANQAQEMLDAMREPAFLGECVPEYTSTLPTTCCDSITEWFPIFVGTELDPPALDVGADDIWVRAYEGTWTDDQGVVHGPEVFAWAAVRVDRIYASIEVMTTAADGSSVTSLEQFEAIVKRMVERAAAAQHGLVLD